MRLWSVVVRNASRPRRGAGVGVVHCIGACSSTHASYSSGSTTRTVKPMRQWSSPQNSAQRPAYVPVRVGVMSSSFSTPGMRSRFSRNSGTQNEWTTSSADEVEAHRLADGQHELGRPVLGRADERRCPRRGSVKRHCHWKPTTSTTTSGSSTSSSTSSCGRRREREQPGDDEERHHRVEDLDGDVVGVLAGDVVVAAPVAHEDVDEQPPHDDGDDDGGRSPATGRGPLASDEPVGRDGRLAAPARGATRPSGGASGEPNVPMPRRRRRSHAVGCGDDERRGRGLPT